MLLAIKNCMSYRQVFFVLLLFVGVSSCKLSQPEFRRVENYTINRSGMGFTMGADVVVYNPNRVRFKVQNLAANVTLNEKVISTIGKEVDILVKGKKEFSLPINISFQLDNNMMNNLGSVLDIIKSKSLRLGFTGNVKFKAYGIIKRQWPFNFTKDFNLGNK